MARILVVEDEDEIREGERVFLEQAGHSVYEATTGRGAYDAWRCESPDLIVLDLSLPEKDGLDICRDIRREDVTTPIIMVTARTEELDELAGLRVGADDYIKKPFSSAILMARVQSLLRRTSSSTELVFSDMTINPQRQAVRLGSSWQQLNTIPFKILYLLASQPNRIFSRDDILNRIYGEDATNVYDRVIDAHIKLIRQSLGGEGVKHLNTVVGSGYRFMP